MATVDRPSLQVFQQFVTTPSVTIPSQYAVVIGKQYEFVEYSDKNDIFAGNYDYTIDADFDYPNKSSASTISTTDVEVFFDDAELEYFYKERNSGNYEFRIVKSSKNKLKTVALLQDDELTFKTSTKSDGTTYNRSSVFDDRDVVVGDITLVTDVDVNITDTKIQRLEADNLASSIEAADANTGNQTTQAHNISATNADPGNTGDATVTSGGTYIGSLESNVLEDIYAVEVIEAGGDPIVNIVADPGNAGDDTLNINYTTSIYDANSSDTYTVTIEGAGSKTPGVDAEYSYTSVNGDNSSAPISITNFGVDHVLGSKGLQIQWVDGADGTVEGGDKWEAAASPSNGRLKITTESGIDDVASKVFPGYGAAFDIAGKGITTSWADGGSGGITVGDKWTIEATKAVDLIIATSSGTYTGTKDLTYIIKVSQGGEYGNAEIEVTSSDTDSSGPTTVPAPVTPVNVGNYNGKISFAANTQNGLVLGDSWTIKANAESDGPFKTIVLNKNINALTLNNDTPVYTSQAGPGNVDTEVVTFSGTYVEENDLLSENVQEIYTLLVTVTGGTGIGKFTIVSSTGTDSQAETTFQGLGVDHNVGQRGIKVKWTGGDGSITQNDTHVITVVKQNLSVNLRLFKNDTSIPRYREDVPGEYAWEAKPALVTLQDNIKISDVSWKNGSEPLPVKDAKVYIVYKAFLPYTAGLDSIGTKEDIESKAGKIHYKNELAYGLWKAKQNSTKNIKFLGLKTDDSDGWDEALSILEKEKDVYFLVPLSFDSGIHSKFRAHVLSVSDPVKKKWRVAVLCKDVPNDEYIYDVWENATTGDDDEIFTATIKDDPQVAGITYNFVEFVDGPVNLIDDNVQVGHIFRSSYTTDQNGNIVYVDYVITEVLSEKSCTISPALSSEVTIPSKCKVLKNLTKEDKKTYIKNYTTGLKNRRIVCVYPDTLIDDANDEVNGYFLASAVAGLKSTSYPHQGLTNFEVAGFTDTPKTYIDLNDDDLTEIASAGAFIVTKDTPQDMPFIRHQLTTNTDSLEYREWSVTTNVDNISYSFDEILVPYIGKYNNTATNRGRMHVRLDGRIEGLKVPINEALGGQLIDGRVVSIDQNETLKDKVDINLEYVVSTPINYITCYQTITV